MIGAILEGDATVAPSAVRARESALAGSSSPWFLW